MQGLSILRCKSKDDGYALYKKTWVPRNYPGRLLRMGNTEDGRGGRMRLIDADEIVKHVYEYMGYSETVIEWLVPCAKMGRKDE